jgi:hypothetical protein
MAGGIVGRSKKTRRRGTMRRAEELCVYGERSARLLKSTERAHNAPSALVDPPSTSSLLPANTAFKGVGEHGKSH